jgi:hypothetical protein
MAFALPNLVAPSGHPDHQTQPVGHQPGSYPSRWASGTDGAFPREKTALGTKDKFLSTKRNGPRIEISPVRLVKSVWW